MAVSADNGIPDPKSWEAPSDLGRSGRHHKDEIKLFSHHIQNNYFEWMEYKVYMDSRPEVYNKKLSGKEDLYATEVAVEKEMIDYQEFLERNKFTHVITTPNVEKEGTAVLDA